MTRYAAAAAVALLVLTGCQPAGEGEPPGETAGQSPPGETAQQTQPEGTHAGKGADSSLPPWTDQPTEVAAQHPGPGGEDGQEISGVRTAGHDGFDRVVLDLTGEEPQLGWFAGFVEVAVHDPSGEEMDLQGPAYLQLGVHGINWIAGSEERYDGTPVAGEGTQVVNEVVFGGLFEGQQQIVIGLAEQTSYRVFGLADPARIVIDIQHP